MQPGTWGRSPVCLRATWESFHPSSGHLDLSAATTRFVGRELWGFRWFRTWGAGAPSIGTR